MTTTWKPREYTRVPLPAKLCNTDRLLDAMGQRGIDGVVCSTQENGLYLSSLATPGSAPEHHGHFNVVLSRAEPEHPVLLMPDIHLARMKWQPTWIEDVRTYASILLPLYADVEPSELHRFVPADLLDSPVGHNFASHYHPFNLDGIVATLVELGLDTAVVGFDDLPMANAVKGRLPEITTVSGEGLLRYARAEKTEAEIELLRKATEINQVALERSIAEWAPGMTWQDLSYLYHLNAVNLGGLFDAPGGMAMGNPAGSDPAWHANGHLDDFELVEGLNIMFDAHGRYDGYCWDGGKTWVVGGTATASTEHTWQATMAAVEEIQNHLAPGQRISEAVDIGLRTYEKFGVDTDGILIFFHGLGLDHLDQEVMAGHRSDWAFTENMVISTHIQVPGVPEERVFVEDIAVVRSNGADRFFTWDLELLRG